jgi:UDP-glucuronate decarboxylase
MHPNDGRVISNFIVQALTNEPITVYGEGTQTRSFCYVDDLIEAIVGFMRTPANVTGPINLGNPEEHSIRQRAETIIKLTGSRSKIIHKPLPSNDPTRRQPNIAKAREILQWKPTTNLEVGLLATIQYFRRSLRIDS